MSRAPSAKAHPAINGRRPVLVRWPGASCRVGVPRSEILITAADPLGHRPILDIVPTDYGAQGKSPLPDLRCPELMALGALAALTIERADEDTDPADHFDDPTDVATVKRDREHNEWAWCMVRVHATIGNLTAASSWLGGCNYANERDFEAAGGYYDDLRAEALEALLGEIKRAVPHDAVAKLVG